MVGRQPAEQLREIAPRLPGERDQLLLERDLAQHPTHQGIAGERRSLELRHQRHAEDQVLAERRVLEVAIALERLDDAGIFRLLHALAQEAAGGENRFDQRAVALWIDDRAQAELEHVAAELHPVERGERLIQREVRGAARSRTPRRRSRFSATVPWVRRAGDGTTAT